MNAPVDFDRIPNSILKNNKVIYLAHNEPNHIWNHKNYFGRKREQRLKAMQYVDKIVSLSPNYIPTFAALFKLPKEKFVAVNHTVEIKPTKSYKSFQKSIITICRIDNKQKRFDRFIEVAKKLPEYSFEIYGGGKDEKYLKTIIKKTKNVSYKGVTNNIKETHSKAGIFLMTSDFEGLSISIIESLSQATPVIIAPNSFDMANKVVISNFNGFVCENFSTSEVVEKINIIEKNYELFSKNTLESFKRYDNNQFIKQWNIIFEEL